MNSSAVIGWNILSSLNTVISANERNQNYIRSYGLLPGLLNCTDDRDQYLQPIQTFLYYH